LAPVFASTLFSSYVLVKRDVSVQLYIAIAAMQACIGFVDLLSIWHVPWAYGGLCVSVLFGFGVGVWALRSERAEKIKRLAGDDRGPTG
jgi:hypothetical protein